MYFAPWDHGRWLLTLNICAKLPKMCRFLYVRNSLAVSGPRRQAVSSAFRSDCLRMLSFHPD